MKLEEALQRIVELEAQIKEQSERYNALESVKMDLENSIKEKEVNIQSLKESNMKFFTMLTAQETNTQTQEQEAPQQETVEAQPWDDFLEDI